MINRLRNNIAICAVLGVILGGQVMTLASPLSGDVNGDGRVDFIDFSVLADNWQVAQGTTWEMGDVSGDGAVNFQDLSLMCYNWCMTGPVQVKLTMSTDGQGVIVVDPNQRTYDVGSSVTLTATGQANPLSGVVCWSVGPWDTLPDPVLWPQVSNGDFEQWLTGIPVPDNSWYKGGLLAADYPVAETGDSYDSQGSTKFLWTGSDSSWNANLLTKSNVLSLKVGEQYTFILAYKGLYHPSGGNRNNLVAQVGYTDSGGGFSSWAGANLTNITANSWVIKQVTFTATSDYARIYLSNQWTTYCLVDAVSLAFQSGKIDIKWETGENIQSGYPIKNTSDVYQGGSCVQFLWTAADATGNGTLVADSAWIKGGLVKTGYPILVSNDTYDGNGSMKFLWTGLDSNYGANSLTRSSNIINLTVGQTYTFKIAFKGLINPDVGYNANQFLAQVGYTNSSGSFTGWSTASVTDNTVGAWTLHSATFTATGSYVRVYLSNQWQTCGLIDAASIGIESKLTKSEVFELTVGQQYSFKVAFKGLNHPTYGTNTNDFRARIGYTGPDGGLALWSSAQISDNTVGSWTVREAIFTATNPSASLFI